MKISEILDLKPCEFEFSKYSIYNNVDPGQCPPESRPNLSGKMLDFTYDREKKKAFFSDNSISVFVKPDEKLLKFKRDFEKKNGLLICEDFSENKITALFCPRVFKTDVLPEKLQIAVLPEQDINDLKNKYFCLDNFIFYGDYSSPNKFFVYGRDMILPFEYTGSYYQAGTEMPLEEKPLTLSFYCGPCYFTKAKYVMPAPKNEDIFEIYKTYITSELEMEKDKCKIAGNISLERADGGLFKADYSGFNGDFLRKGDGKLEFESGDEQNERVNFFIDSEDIKGKKTPLSVATRPEDSAWNGGKIKLSAKGAETVWARRSFALWSFLSSEKNIVKLKEIILLRGGSVTNKKSEQDCSKNWSKIKSIFGFDFSDSQKAAIRKAVNTEDICVIQGPPGTGKTTVINAIAYLLIEAGHDVAIGAQQNETVDNVFDKFPVYDVPPERVFSPSAEFKRVSNYVGKIIEWFKSRSQSVKDVYKEEFKEEVDKSPFYEIMKIKEENEKALEEVLDKGFNEEAVKELIKCVKSAKYCGNRFNIDFNFQPHLENYNKIKKARSILAEKIFSLKAFEGLNDEEKGKILDSCKKELDHQVNKNCDLKKEFKKLIEALDEETKKKHPARLFAEIEGILKSLIEGFLEPNNAYRKQFSFGAFHYLLNNLADYLKDNIRDSDTKELKKILKKSVYIYSTMHLSTLQLFGNRNDKVYDYVIIDEAARANPADLLILMASGKKWILVGDQNQLPAYIDDACLEKLQENEIEKLKEGVFKKMYDNYKENAAFLNEDRRMHPILSKFVSDNFYNKSIKSCCTENERRINKFDFPALFIDVQGRGEQIDEGLFNQEEIEKIMEFVGSNINNFSDKSVGIASFYRCQSEKLKERLKEKFRDSDNISVGTVDSFQGREFDIFIVSCVRTTDIGFLEIPERLNVAFSRAKSLLVMVGNKSFLKKKSGVFKKYAELCDKNSQKH